MYPLDEELKGVQVLAKRPPAGLRRFIFGEGLFPYKFLSHAQISVFLQHADMGCEIAVRDVEGRPESCEIDRVVDDENRHDRKPDPILKDGVQVVKDLFHLSCLRYMVTP